jgi:hypothetical protein
MSFRIMSAPLFHLEELFRGTGPYSKRLMIRVTEAPCSIEYRIDFADPVWIKMTLENRDGEVVGEGGGSRSTGTFEIGEPGQYGLTVNVLSDSDQLREMDRFRGDIHLHPRGRPEGGSRIRLEIDEIRDMEALSGYFAIDLGTTNSTAVYFDASDPELHDSRFSAQEIGFGLLDNEGTSRKHANTVPTDLFIKDPRNLVTSLDASLLGERAQKAADDPDSNLYDSCYIRAAKTVLATDKVWNVWFDPGSGQPERERVRPPDVLAAVLKKLIAHATREMKKRISSVIMTYPPQWSFVERRALEGVIDRIRPAIQDDRRKLSLRMNIDEASAAGLYYIYEQVNEPGFWNQIQLFRVNGVDPEAGEKKKDEEPDRYRFKTLAFDFGGGSLDLSLIQYELLREVPAESSPGAMRTRIKVRLLDADSLAHDGGNYVTLRLFELLKRRIALTVAHPDQALRAIGEGDDTTDRYAGIDASSLEGPVLDFQQSDDVQYARNILLTKWDQVKSAMARPTLEGLVSRLVDRHESDFPTAWGDEEIDAAIETILPTRWRDYEEGSEEHEEARANFRKLWHAAEKTKQYLVNRFNGLLGTDCFEPPAFEEAFASFGEVVSLKPGDLFPKMKGSVPYERDVQLLKRVCFLSLQDVFLCSAPVISKGIRRAERMSEPFRDGEALPYNWVIVAGNSSRSPLVRYLFMRLTPLVDPSQIKGNIANAKVAVAKGACINSIIRGLVPGLQFETHSFATKIPRDLKLFWTGGDHDLFTCGPLSELQSRELKLGVIDAQMLTVKQTPSGSQNGAPEEVAGVFQYRDENGGYAPGATPIPNGDTVDEVTRAIADEYGHCPSARELRDRKEREALDEVCPACEPKVTYGEILSKILNRYDFPEIVAWCEADEKTAPRAPEESVQRFYLSREMVLYMVEHTPEGKTLFTWEPSPEDRLREADVRLDPFSGAH